MALTGRTTLFSAVGMANGTPHGNYDVSPDGQTFVMVGFNQATRIVIIQNLPALIAKLRAAAGVLDEQEPMSEIQSKLEAALASRYHFQRLLGAGGMATVYLARDLRHERQVAVKVLRPELAVVIGADRFLAEIKLTANLQHPHILPLHDSGEADGLVYYVMPYIEGESLRDRVSREHQLPVDEAVRIATEVADALEYAHAHGVIHRDVKPENVLLHGGHALVADFGIALAASRGEGATRMTETGMSLGTPAYMAPEQAMGEREITPKADIYALGAVLYEMLSGEPPFVGPTAQAIVARMMTEEPRPLSLQRHTVPLHVEAAVRKALEKLPADRFASAAEFKAALRDHSFVTTRSMPAVAAASSPRRLIAAIPWALAAVALVAALTVLLRPRPPGPVNRYGLGLPLGLSVLEYRAVPAPDGSSLVFVGPISGQSSEMVFQLWIKHRDRYDAVPVPGTSNVWNVTYSPDSRWVAFIQNAQLMKIPVSGGSPIFLADSAAPAQPGIAWLDDGSIVFVERGGRALRRVPSEGGPTQVVFRAERQINEPAPLPGSQAVLASECAGVACDNTNLIVVDLRSGTHKLLVPGASMGRYLSSGHLLYLRADFAAFAVAFDPGRLEVRGSPVSVTDSVAPSLGGAQIDVSQAGTLVVRRGAGQGVASGTYELVWLDRSGNASPINMGGPLRIDPGGGNPGWVLSPDGSRIAIALLTPSGGDVWVKELPNGPLSRVTFDSAPDIRPRWLADGRSLVYITDRGTGYELHQTRADGTGGDTLLMRHEGSIYEGVVSPDGEWIVARIRGGLGAQGRDIVGFRRGDTVAVPLIANAGMDENALQLSPDGRWIAYESDETGRREVYIRPFPNTNAGKWQASTDGGYAPLWAPSGRELFFVDIQRRMTAVPFTPGPVPRLGDRRVLFAMDPALYLWENDYYTPFDISRDGKRFLMARRIQSQGVEQAPLIVVENWLTELRQKLERQ